MKRLTEIWRILMRVPDPETEQFRGANIQMRKVAQHHSDMLDDAERQIRKLP